MEFKNHCALKSTSSELPKEVSFLRSNAFKRTKYLSHVSKLVKRKIALEEENNGNILEQFSTRLKSGQKKMRLARNGLND